VGKSVCVWEDWGRLPYGEALLRQKEAVRRRIAGEVPDALYLVEHPPVITLGKTAKAEHVLDAGPGVEVVQSDRGGDVTFHGPGQVVGYPVIDLNALRQDVRWYLDGLEEVMIGTAARWGIRAVRIAGMTGVWVEDRKIGAIGVRLQRWVSCHGFALNVNTDLSYFDRIVPCGLRGKGVTSIARETGREADLGEVRRAVVEAFGGVFGRDMRPHGEARLG
jgi:lipoyl(octanoyl) transferase